MRLNYAYDARDRGEFHKSGQKQQKRILLPFSFLQNWSCNMAPREGCHLPFSSDKTVPYRTKQFVNISEHFSKFLKTYAKSLLPLF